MNTKSRFLGLLLHSQDGYVSGQAAAQRLGVSRAAVWKAVQALQAQGLQIEAREGCGYRLQEEGDLLSREAVWAWLNADDVPLRVFEEIDSTNLEAKRWALAAAPHGALVVSGRQTAGRGRLGRQFASPSGGLYLSMVLRPAKGLQAAVLFTTAAAVAVCRVVSALCEVELGIKWVNDLYFQEKKCCGILTEAGTDIESGGLEYVVVGIGINYTTPSDAFPPEVARLATSLFAGGGAPASRARLAASIYWEMRSLTDVPDTGAFMAEYRARSLALGRVVTVQATPSYTAKAVAIEDDGRLVVEKGDGSRVVLSYGEISIVL